jgi:hypothetical protein
MQVQGTEHAAATEQGTNGKAIASVILGVIGVTGVPFMASIVALILGYMARGEIAETGQEGRGLATAGIILGWVGVAVFVLALAFFSFVFVSVTG